MALSSLPRIITSLLATLLVALVVGVGTLPPAPADAADWAVDLERDFHALVNVERAKEGLGALTLRTDIRTVARRHSQTMAGEWDLFHNPDFSSQITGWQRVAENVGFGPSVDSIHGALMNSEGHRRNILDDRVTEVGIGVLVKDGRVWVTQNFRRPSGTVSYSDPSSTRFGDVRSTSTHAGAIERMAVRGVTEDCGAARYCPGDDVTRADFAGMLVRSLELERPASTTGHFSDVSGDEARDAEALYDAGLTNGCEAGRFCPDTRLTREQLASFFARALDLTPSPSPFSDTTRTHDGSIGALAKAGITNGCTTSTFCPTDRVTRAQAASMLSRNLD